MKHQSDEAARLWAATRTRSPDLCPEISLRLAPAGLTLDVFRNTHPDICGAAPPYWAVAWPGGQGAARYVLDHPEIVAGRQALDFGAGSGLIGIAAAMAGAARVRALDRDPAATAVCALNARLNAVFVEAETMEITSVDAVDADIVLAGDLWYERFDARRATRLLRALARGGATVLIGDLGRTQLPRSGIDWLASYHLSADEALERSATVETRVGRLVA
ncbi:MAG: class I SAM-dependent methyltransferase [Methyloligellaceae bacterium]